MSKKARVIHFIYLNSILFQKTTSGGEKDSLSGPMLVKPDPYSKAITNRVFPPI